MHNICTWLVSIHWNWVHAHLPLTSSYMLNQVAYIPTVGILCGLSWLILLHALWIFKLWNSFIYLRLLCLLIVGDKRETRSTGSVRPVILQQFYRATLYWCDFIIIIIIMKKVGDCFWEPSQQFAKALPSIGTCILSFPLELSVRLFSVQMSTRYINRASRTPPSMLMHYRGAATK